MAYSINIYENSITCKNCGLTSHNRWDVHFRWCENCQIFHEPSRIKRILSENLLEHLVPVTRESLVEAGYLPFHRSDIDYTHGELTFGLDSKGYLDLYYYPEILFARIVTGKLYSTKRVLFEGRVESMSELKWLVSSLIAYLPKVE